MPSLLATERMSPELRARIQQSLKGDARSRVGGASPLSGSRGFRLLTFLGVVLLGCAITVTFRSSRDEFRKEKARLLADYRVGAQLFTGDFRARLHHLEAQLKQAQAPYPGDFLAPQFAQGGLATLDQILVQPLVAVRGSTREFETADARRTTWGEGGPDSLARCLMVPPKDTKEGTLLRHLGHIYQPRIFAGRFVNTEPAFEGVSFIDSPFHSQLQSASLMSAVVSARRRLERAKLEDAAPFSRALHLLYAFDEPKAPGVVSDFDGEAEHFVQVGLVELKTGKHLFRFRRRVDPDWLTDKSRISYSRQLDSCRLAYEIREEIAGAR